MYGILSRVYSIASTLCRSGSVFRMLILFMVMVFHTVIVTLLIVTTEFNGALREQVRTSTEVKNVYERTLQTLDRVEKRIEVLEDTVRENQHKGARR